MSPSRRYLPTSPVRYIRLPSSPLNGSGMNLSPVPPSCFSYPRATPSPPMYISPRTPIGTGLFSLSNIYTFVFCTGLPIGALLFPPTPGPTPYNVAHIVASVGPYPFITLDPGVFLTISSNSPSSIGSTPTNSLLMLLCPRFLSRYLFSPSTLNGATYPLVILRRLSHSTYPAPSY